MHYIECMEYDIDSMKINFPLPPLFLLVQHRQPKIIHAKKKVIINHL